jgi:hypothetical protein
MRPALIAACGLWLVVSALSCRRTPEPADWTRFPKETVAGSLGVLAAAEETYAVSYQSKGVDKACEGAVNQLRVHASVQSA